MTSKCTELEPSNIQVGGSEGDKGEGDRGRQGRQGRRGRRGVGLLGAQYKPNNRTIGRQVVRFTTKNPLTNFFHKIAIFTDIYMHPTH